MSTMSDEKIKDKKGMISLAISNKKDSDKKPKDKDKDKDKPMDIPTGFKYYVENGRVYLSNPRLQEWSEDNEDFNWHWWYGNRKKYGPNDKRPIESANGNYSEYDEEYDEESFAEKSPLERLRKAIDKNINKNIVDPYRSARFKKSIIKGNRIHVEDIPAFARETGRSIVKSIKGKTKK